jgi:hypothetical protein
MDALAKSSARNFSKKCTWTCQRIRWGFNSKTVKLAGKL